jgi:hypothetical protein
MANNRLDGDLCAYCGGTGVVTMEEMAAIIADEVNEEEGDGTARA